MSRSAWPVTVGLVLSCGACGAGESDAAAAGAPGAPVGLSEAPAIIVGERPGDLAHELFAVGAPFVLPGGGLGVPLLGDETIRIYDESGEFVRSLGSEGQGPGEFVRLAAAWARGDTVEAFDPEMNRITRFVPEGPPETVMLEGVASAQVAAPGLDDGSWILFGVQEVKASGRDVIAVHRFASGGSHMGRLLETEGFRRHEFPGGRGPDPLSPRAVVRTAGQSVYVAETLTPRIMVVDVVSGATQAVEWEWVRRISGNEAIRIARDALTSSGVPEGERRWNLASFEAMAGDEQAPVFWDFLVDGGDFLWVRDYDPSIHGPHGGGLGYTGPGGVWSVLDREGTRVSEVVMPQDFEPTSIDSDYIIGIRRDGMDVESVRVYLVERSSR